MSKTEKFEFILYQIKLQYLLKDLTRIIIVCRKINPKHLEEEGFEYIKLSYYLYKFHYHKHSKEYKEATDCLVEAFKALSKDRC